MSTKPGQLQIAQQSSSSLYETVFPSGTRLRSLALTMGEASERLPSFTRGYFSYLRSPDSVEDRLITAVLPTLMSGQRGDRSAEVPGEEADRAVGLEPGQFLVLARVHVQRLLL